MIEIDIDNAIFEWQSIEKNKFRILYTYKNFNSLHHLTLFEITIDGCGRVKPVTPLKLKKLKKGGDVNMVIKFSEIKPKANLDLPDKRIRIEKLIDETFTIERIHFLNSKFRDGKYAIVVAKQKKKEFWFSTTSTVLLKQLEQIQQVMEEKNDKVEVTLRKVKNYYTFE